MATEFVADASERLIQTMRALGVSQKVAGMVAAEWQASIEKDWGGERPYIGKSAAAARAMSARDAALLRDWQAGERSPLLARKYQISASRVRQIIQTASALS